MWPCHDKREDGMKISSLSVRVIIGLCFLGLSMPLFGETIPDFTKGEEQKLKNRKDSMRPRVMGPTGLWGITYAEKMMKGATRDARQFLISRVDTGSPADGKIMKGDVVLGVNGKNFESDARKVLANAILKAEETDGKLSLHIWRDGNVQDVGLTLLVLGTYDPNNPYNCAHTEGVIDQLAQYAKQAPLPPAKRSNDDPKMMFPSLYALGMLATGRDDLMPKIQAYAHSLRLDKSGKPITTFDVSSNGKRVWHTAYRLIFLSEYYMATGDEVIKPYLETIAVGAAQGQSGAGTYGHRFSSRQPDGSFHGPLEGYGAINQAALSMMTGLLLAQKAGIKHPDITRAIAKGKRFFDFFVDHGAISYGDHWAIYDSFDNNGTSGLAAVMYQFMGDNPGQEFFSSMMVASSPTGREDGHQGCYWTALWGELGSARAGKEALLASTGQMRYIRTLERHWSGMAYDQGNIGPDRYGSREDVTGSRLLLYSMGKARLYLNGKDMAVAHPLTGTELKTALAGGRMICNEDLRKEIPLHPLMRLLGSKLPPIRMTAAKAMQEQDINQVDILIKMLNVDNRYFRYGACNALSMAGFSSTEVVEAIVKRLQADEDILFRYYAVDALTRSTWGKDEYGLTKVSHMAAPTLLALAGKPVPGDPRGHLSWKIAEASFYSNGIYDRYVKEHPVDEQLLASAVAQFLQNENGRARSMVPFAELPDAVLDQVWPEIIAAVRENAPSGIMFSKGVREQGVIILGKHKIKEGLDALKELSETFGAIPYEEERARYVPWFGKPMFEALPNFGKHAEPVLATVEKWPVLEGRGKDFAKQIPELKKKLEAAGYPTLKSIAR
jgi:hypothetical protein